MGRLKRKYLQRSPIIITKEDGSVYIEGVSDKKTPSVVDYKSPEYLFRGNPGPDGSGDLGIFPEPDLGRPRQEFAGLKAYEDASPEVKDVLSLKFAKRRDHIAVVKEDYRMMVAEHMHDYDSNVVSIAMHTIKILNLQKMLGILASRGWNCPGYKWRLRRAIDKRRAQLGVLRQMDYPKYEWLLEKLNIVHKPRPFVYESVVRRRHTERLVNLLCDEIRGHKLQDLKDDLEEDQPNFLKRKADTLKKIQEEEKKFNLKPTVSDADIDRCYSELKKVEEQLKQREKRTLTYHVFKEKETKPQNTFLS